MEWIKDRWGGKLILKGVQDEEGRRGAVLDGVEADQPHEAGEHGGHEGPEGAGTEEEQDLQRADASIQRIQELLALRPKLKDGNLSLPPGALDVELLPDGGIAALMATLTFDERVRPVQLDDALRAGARG